MYCMNLLSHTYMVCLHDITMTYIISWGLTLTLTINTTHLTLAITLTSTFKYEFEHS